MRITQLQLDAMAAKIAANDPAYHDATRQTMNAIRKADRSNHDLNITFRKSDCPVYIETMTALTREGQRQYKAKTGNHVNVGIRTA